MESWHELPFDTDILQAFHTGEIFEKKLMYNSHPQVLSYGFEYIQDKFLLKNEQLETDGIHEGYSNDEDYD